MRPLCPEALRMTVAATGVVDRRARRACGWMDVGRAVGRRVVCGVVVGGVSLLALPAAGEAGTVLVRHENDREGRPTTPVASFQAASGERNDVALAHNEDEGVV